MLTEFKQIDTAETIKTKHKTNAYFVFVGNRQ